MQNKNIRFLIKAYNNTDWMSDTDWILLQLSDKDIEDIYSIQKVFKEHLSEISCSASLFNKNFIVISNDTLSEYPELYNFTYEYNNPIIIPDSIEINLKEIPQSDTINEIRLTGYVIKIYKNVIICTCYGKYDNNIEVFSDELMV
jgi:hypothetical protein